MTFETILKATVILIDFCAFAALCWSVYKLQVQVIVLRQRADNGERRANGMEHELRSMRNDIQRLTYDLSHNNLWIAFNKDNGITEERPFRRGPYPSEGTLSEGTAIMKQISA